MKKSAQVLHKGFTLVELLVVIAIIAILAAVVVLIINPLELTMRGRDAARLSDLMNLQNAINVALQEGSAAAQQSPACNDNTATGVTCGPNRTYPSGANTRLTNGTGWVQINFAGQSNVTVPTLPVDPTNNGAASTEYHYTYCGDGAKWIIKARLESQQQRGKMSTDGDTDNNSYAVGSDMSLVCAY
ncbi:MAG: prepilin-type N-terminal cleavage/methylation domain-containing protein [Patescibacteria group bacterium]|nr:prepilin-type N-terminal cleavage/methylation domain-containing protein [Patescibacteria group bacterium]